MLTTTRCLFALGLSVSLFAACGDDDDDGFGGGSGGRAGSSGGGGRAGTGGGGTGGGTGGTAAGTGGSTGGTGGSTAGTGGSTAGTGGSGATGGSDPGDAGPDATADGGDVDPPTDGGVEPIACPDLDDALADADGAGTQGVIIARVVFEGTNAVVTFKAINGDFDFAGPLQLCTGSEAGDCDDAVQDLEGNGNVDGGVGDLLEGESIEITTSLLGTTAVTAASGELALVNGEPDADTDPIIRAYINWGNYVSPAATEGPNLGESLEDAALDDNVWATGDTIEVNGQTTIYADGDVTDENGFAVCTQD
jgi:hypothetical protein